MTREKMLRVLGLFLIRKIMCRKLYSPFVMTFKSRLRTFKTDLNPWIWTRLSESWNSSKFTSLSTDQKTWARHCRGCLKKVCRNTSVHIHDAWKPSNTKLVTNTISRSTQVRSPSNAGSVGKLSSLTATERTMRGDIWT